MQDLFTEIYKTLLKTIKNSNKQKDILWTGNDNTFF